MRLIEAYKEWETTQIDGLTYPAECVLEGDDGIRVGLLTSLRAVRGHLWFRLHSSGVRYLVAPEGGAWAAIKTDRYLQLKAEHGDEFTLASGWKVYPSFPSYFDLEDEEVKATEFVHLHAHSDFSPLDGLSKVEEMVEAVVADNQPALALTDHGSCAGHPLLSQTAGKHDIKPIFGIEANFVYDRFLRKNQYDYYHLILWAKTDTGLRNLWAMNTEAYREGFYGRPRMDWDTLSRHAEGVMASTACLRGPVSRRLLEDDEEGARMILSRLLAIFGDDLYVEIQTNSLGEQRKVNEGLISLARDLSLPVILASDSHYPTKADQDVHRVWIAAQTNKDLQDDTGLFVGDSHYHLMTGSEAAESVSYLPPGVVAEAMKNTVVVAEKVEAAMGGKAKPPVFSKGEAPVDKDVDRLLRLCLSNWGRIMGKTNPPEVYEARFEKEMHLLISKGYCGYFLMVSDYCRMARERGILVGPGRGSGAGSLVAYLAGITGIDPVEADLMFERFLTEGRNALPDFDVDFPTSKRQEITDYIIGRYGQENVVRVGTHIRLKNKGVVRALNRVLRNTIDIHYPDIEAISKIIDTAEADKAGLGMSWEDLWDEYEEELTPYKTKYPDLFRYAEKMVGRLHTYGKHAAGVVIAPDTRLTDNLPLRTAGDDIVAEFDMESLESLGLVKFDLLTLSTLDKIQMCVDLIREETGDDIDITAWDEEYRDPVVWEQIGLGNTLGIFQIETPGSTRDTEELKPTNLDELSDVITLVRPGPKRSGLTDLYLKRKRGEEPVSYLDPRLEPILDKTFGCMIYQEQVIRTCMVLAGYNETEADDVRKILGKKKIELVEEAGKTFIERAIANKTSPEVAETIWAQMAEFARYSFNRSHAYSYAMLGYWTAWLKFNYPIQFLTSALSTVEKGRIPEFIAEANRMGYRVLPPDINLSGSGFRAAENTIRYGFDGVKGIGAAAVEAITQGQPYTSFDDFMERKGGKANSGVVKLLVAVGAFDSLGEDRRLLEEKMEWQDGIGDKCAYWDDRVIGPNGLPCTFDWSSEPVQIGSRGQPLKPKPIPKRCTKACRNFTPRTFTAPESLVPITPEEIQRREVELLGVYLSSSPFDAIPPDMWGMEVEPGIFMVHGSEVKRADRGRFVVAALISRARPHTAKTGQEMGFVGLNAVDAELDCVVFSDEWKEYRADLKPGRLGLAYVRKTDRGINLLAYHPI